LGSWLLDPALRILSLGGEPANLTPRSWDVLIHLLAHRGEVVTTETLLAEYWRGWPSDDVYVRKCISEIRSVLGDSIANPKYIRTVPRHGYVLLPEPAVEPTAPPPAMPVLAVLPFINVSSDQENEYFSDGLTEEILNKLARGTRAPVIARTSSFHFKGLNVDIREIARSLSASHVLEGSVRKAADSVRITAQLIDAASGVHLWSDTYERALINVFAVQDEIAVAVCREVARRIEARGDEPAGQINAVYLSRRFMKPDDFARLVRVIAQDTDRPSTDDDG